MPAALPYRLALLLSLALAVPGGAEAPRLRLVTLPLALARVAQEGGGPMLVEHGGQLTALGFPRDRRRCVRWEDPIPADYGTHPILLLRASRTTADAGEVTLETFGDPDGPHVFCVASATDAPTLPVWQTCPVTPDRTQHGTHLRLHVCRTMRMTDEPAPGDLLLHEAILGYQPR